MSSHLLTYIRGGAKNVTPVLASMITNGSPWFIQANASRSFHLDREMQNSENIFFSRLQDATLTWS